MAVSDKITDLRERRPGVDHALRTQEHYGAVKAGQQAGAVTYFAFLSFFPILALSFFVVGYVARVYPNADQDLTAAINSILPGIIGNGESQISLDDVASFSGLAGVVGVLGVLYSGLGWVSALRDALTTVFETPSKEQPSFVKGKLRDLMTLVVIGLVLLVSVAVAGFVSGFSEAVLGWIGLDSELGWAVRLLAVALGLAANTVLFFAMFKLLAEPHVPSRSLWSGALLGAVAFEALKQVSGVLFGLTTNQPAFQAFGIALILVVWINYFSRLVMYAASWAYTTPEARLSRVADPADPVQGPGFPPLADRDSFDGADPASRGWVAPFAAGGAATLALVALLRRKDDQ